MWEFENSAFDSPKLVSLSSFHQKNCGKKMQVTAIEIEKVEVNYDVDLDEILVTTSGHEKSHEPFI